MNKEVEMALRLFSPRGMLPDSLQGVSVMTRELILGALQVAAKSNPLGLHYLMANHLLDEAAWRALSEHFTARLGEQGAAAALSLLLRRPLPAQMDSLVRAHPLYDSERRRAAVLMERSRRAKRHRKRLEARKLKEERDSILAAARERCMTDILQTGRCPKCQGTGRRPKVGDECPLCFGTGRVIPDRALVQQTLGHALCQLVEQEVDAVLVQASELSAQMKKQVEQMMQHG